MRDYGVVSPKFWIGETGKALRGNAPAQVLALYLMTCPHANMIGVFHCPVLYMAHETGLGMEGASKALQSLIEAGYCTYDEASETVFVHRMAAYQVAESLKPGDNRVKGVEREWSNIGPAHLKSAFAAIYSVAFHLPVEEAKASPFQDPPKVLGSQEHDQEHDQKEEPNGSLSAAAQPTDDTEPDDGVPPCPFVDLIDLYEAALPALATVRRSLFAKGANGKSMKARWRWVMTAKHERGERQGERLATTAAEGKAWFARYFDYVAESDFLSGRSGKFQACDLGWLVTASNFEKVLSGKYHHELREVANA